MPGQIPIPTSIIHMTHVNNLVRILGAGELLATARLMRTRVEFTNIAYSSIQEQRATKHVPCGPRGSLHDYVPFYFCNRSPMLYTINRGNVACEGGQGALVHLRSTAQAVEASGLGFAFSDGHGIMDYSEFFDDLADLNAIDWDVIRATYWHDTTEDGDRKRRRQAEFLVHDRFPWTLVSDIVVNTESMRQRVQQMIANQNHRPNISVLPNWYY